jgi:hypothetical protein
VNKKTTYKNFIKLNPLLEVISARETNTQEIKVENWRKELVYFSESEFKRPLPKEQLQPGWSIR